MKPASDFEEIISFFRTLVFFIVALVFFQASVVQAFKIPSSSMWPTLKEGDYIFVSKLSYGIHIPFRKVSLYQFDTPDRGDIVVFTRPDDPSTNDEDESSINIIKRVVGLPGDTVEVRGTSVYINNEKLTEPYAKYQDGGIPAGDFGPAKVPEGHVFLLGDNRDQSKDSRFWHPSHFLDIQRIKGRALIIYWSWQDDLLSRIGTLIR